MTIATNPETAFVMVVGMSAGFYTIYWLNYLVIFK